MRPCGAGQYYSTGYRPGNPEPDHQCFLRGPPAPQRGVLRPRLPAHSHNLGEYKKSKG